MSDETNGAQRGRAVPPLPTFTFKDGGRTVQIRKLSPMTAQEIDRQTRAQFPPPKPPLVEVPGPHGKPVKEPNEADPDYITALEDWGNEHYQRSGKTFLRLIALRAVVCAVDQAELDQFKADMAAVGMPIAPEEGLTPDQSDKVLYVNHILVGSPQDMQELQAFVTQRSQPTPEVVAAHRESFRDDVSTPPAA